MYIFNLIKKNKNEIKAKHWAQAYCEQVFEFLITFISVDNSSIKCNWAQMETLINWTWYQDLKCKVLNDGDEVWELFIGNATDDWWTDQPKW